MSSHGDSAAGNVDGNLMEIDWSTACNFMLFLGNLERGKLIVCVCV